ncbi:GerAB/ArcD/ProY family transporter [Clostridium sp. C8-1-8]|uniref:GerAB/ArcD/ProY family transporter n=1 Tax=Clostridium sp. C8-1-8 TaxID=2698831 RepID=UPI00136BA10B|nr:GerAB/ArcD/ProY family transporter [Clostridium sp. C8-1-8]
MNKLSDHQLFSLMFIFEIGSTTIFALGIGAKQNAWIVILLALVIGIIFMFIYTELQKSFPDKNYIGIAKLILGNKIGTVVVLMYMFDLIWHCARNTREFSELLIMTLLPTTPMYIILIFFIGASVHVLIKGIEVFARLGELIFYAIIISMLAIYFFIYISGKLEFSNLLPVLNDGLKPVLKQLPIVIMFPFGEVFVFIMYWNMASEKELLRKTGVKVVFYSGILLCMSVIMDICALGAEYTDIATIPLVETIKLINIEGVISNIDALGVIIMFLGGFFKMTVYLNAINIVFTNIFKIKNFNLSLLCMGVFLLFFSIMFEPNYAYHKWMVNYDSPYYAIIHTNIIPLILLLVLLIKKKRIEF